MTCILIEPCEVMRLHKKDGPYLAPGYRVTGPNWSAERGYFPEDYPYGARLAVEVIRELGPLSVRQRVVLTAAIAAMLDLPAPSA